ncbi:MAG: hypothetical protein QOD06_3155 [Candidatus Binatota bacterium]|nr:hypothetical protein [Candidatus Binatota bacterium]
MLMPSAELQREIPFIGPAASRRTVRQMLPPLIEYSYELVEQAVAERVRGDREEEEYRRLRQGAEAAEDPAERTAARRNVDRAWFTRLGLDQPIALALAEVALSRSRVPRVVLAPAWTEKDEGAALLLVPPQEASFEKPERSILMLLRPERFHPGANLLVFLETELRRVATMIPKESAVSEPVVDGPKKRSLNPAVVGRFLARWR